jgi:hypothetical protein
MTQTTLFLQLREQAIALRRAGRSRREIKELLRITSNERPIREAEREAASAAATAEIGKLNDREVLIAGAIAYWCEGAKNKPYRRSDRVVFMNSDPALIGFFVRFLDVAGIPRDRLIYQVQIHETADADTAQDFWLNVTRAHLAQFRRPTLKRHNPRTVRRNVGADYHGCLRVEVRCSTALYRKIEGWAAAAMASPDGAGTHDDKADPVEGTAQPD